jgi:hypothetical protein
VAGLSHSVSNHEKDELAPLLRAGESCYQPGPSTQHMEIIMMTYRKEFRF